jgi:hypothetical protein
MTALIWLPSPLPNFRSCATDAFSRSLLSRAYRPCVRSIFKFCNGSIPAV